MSAQTVDARNRALRTAVQGIAFDVLAALALLLYPIISDADGWGDFQWKVLGFLVVKTAAVAALSYAMRTWLGTKFPPKAE